MRKNESVTPKKIPKHQLRDDQLVNENSTTFVSTDPGFTPERDGYGGTIVYQCVHCDHQTRWKSALKRHFHRMHGLKPKKPVLKPGEKLYDCALCKHSTKWQSAYRRHMRAKHGIVKKRSLSRKEKHRFKCALCAYEGYKVEEVAKHIAVAHSGYLAESKDTPVDRKFKRGKLELRPAKKFGDLQKRRLRIYEVVYNFDLFAPRMDHNPLEWL